LVSQEAGQGGAEVGATLDPNPSDGGVLVEPGSELPVTDRGVGDAGRGQMTAGQAARVSLWLSMPQNNWTTSMWSGDDGPAARRHALG
jgi:hypothetical protein